MRDLRYLEQVARVSLRIVPLVIAPVMVLTWLAVGSLRSEGLLLDATLRQRAEATAAQVQAGQRALFTAFEEDVTARLNVSDAAMATLTSPALRGAFRFHADGRLAWPFVLAEPSASPPPSAAWRRGWLEAQRTEATGSKADARARYLELAEREQEPIGRRIAARLAAARALAEQDPDTAEIELVLAAADAGDARDDEGYRLADVAHILQAALAERARRPIEAAALRRTVVERALAAAWTVGQPSDGLLARIALADLRGHMPADSHALATQRVLERLEDLHWAGLVQDELRLVASRGGPVGAFSYQPESLALWVVYQGTDGLWAFSFDGDALRTEISRRVVAVAADVDQDLSASLVSPGTRMPDALARRSLAPELPKFDVVVRATDPAELAARRSASRNLQRLAIVLAVLATGLGLGLTVRTIDRELEAARRIADFAANVSHELRSPITQIRLKAEALQLDLVEDDADRTEHHDAIVRESERLSRLVDNVLDFSSIERGVRRYHLRPDDLGEAVVKAADATRAAASNAGFQIVVDLPDDLPVVWLDREAMGQVLTNLLSNAVKYGGAGGTITVSVTADEDAVRVGVSDPGIGIAPDDQLAIFEHFYRVPSAEVRKQRGTGIGLTIVRYIVEAHGGTISVESAIGRGSTFTVSLPTQPPPDAGA